MRWTPEELAYACQGKLVRRSDRAIATAFIDSRTPVAGALFVPIVARRDGHAFCNDAIQNGATAVLVQRGHEIPKGDVTVVEVADTGKALWELARDARSRQPRYGGQQGPVVAITGSNGKTTTRAMVEAVVATAYHPVLATSGNFNTWLGVPLTLLGEPHASEAMVVELGMSAPGENDALAGLVRPTIGIITSVAPEHLEFMGSLDAVVRAEAELVRHIPAGGALVLPGDEPLLLEQVPAEYQPKVLHFAAGEHALVEVRSVEVGVHTNARFHVRGHGDVEIRLHTFGAHNARNAAAALCVGLHLGLELPAMVAALEAVAPVGNRGRVLKWRDHLLIADCYNANPGSMESALRSFATLRPRCSGPLVAVLGDMLELGPTEDELHAAVGTLVAELGLDFVVAFGPRSRHLAEAARSGGIQATHVLDDVNEVVALVRRRLEHAASGAVLCKASLGMRFSRVVEGLRR